MDAGTLIRQVRRRRGLTQSQLAVRAGTSQPVISAYEHGARDPTLKTLRKLVEAGGEQLVVGADAPAAGIPPATDDHERARRLEDLLTLADAIPVRPRPSVLVAPRLESTRRC